MGKRNWLLSVIYIAAIAFLPPVLGWTSVAQRSASVFVFIERFTNLVPLMGIVEALRIALDTGRIAYLTRYMFNMLVLIPAGLLCGLNRRQLKIVAVQYAVVLMLVYGLRVVLKLGSFDVDDILLNLLGLSLGWRAGVMLNAISKKRRA